jgi:hypothetical protein
MTAEEQEPEGLSTSAKVILGIHYVSLMTIVLAVVAITLQRRWSPEPPPAIQVEAPEIIGGVPVRKGIK